MLLFLLQLPRQYTFIDEKWFVRDGSEKKDCNLNALYLLFEEVPAIDQTVCS